jgi:hypothetical protein
LYRLQKLTIWSKLQHCKGMPLETRNISASTSIPSCFFPSCPTPALIQNLLVLASIGFAEPVPPKHIITDIPPMWMSSCQFPFKPSVLTFPITKETEVRATPKWFLLYSRYLIVICWRHLGDTLKRVKSPCITMPVWPYLLYSSNSYKCSYSE